VYWADPPLRHGDLIIHMARVGVGGIANTSPRYQGFVTTHGRFVDRREALGIAERAKQLVRKTGNAYRLFSEDLWI
jgi:hypothetical protein